MRTGQKPGMSYEDMWELIYRVKQPVAKMISNELLIAIFWEESLFNNVEQTGGTAWGFGQVEPSQFYWLQTDQAKQYGYYVAGLPRTIVLERDENGAPIKVKLAGILTQEQGVQVASGILCHWCLTQNGLDNALNAYAGVSYKGTNVPTRLKTGEDRKKIIEGWRDCEAFLKREFKPKPPEPKKKAPQGPPMPEYPADYPTFIKTGLHKARAFLLNDKTFDDILFPKNAVNEAGERVWRPQVTPGWLQDLAARNWK